LKKKLSLCYSILYYYNGAQRYEQFLPVQLQITSCLASYAFYARQHNVAMQSTYQHGVWLSVCHMRHTSTWPHLTCPSIVSGFDLALFSSLSFERLCVFSLYFFGYILLCLYS